MNNNEKNISNELSLNFGMDQSIKLEQEIDLVSDCQKKAKLLLDFGLIETSKKNYEKAIKHIEEAQKYFLEVKDITNIAICLTELALIHYYNCNDRLIRSLTLLNDAKYLLENENAKADAEAKAKVLHYYGIIYYSEKRFSEALKYYKNAQKLIGPDCLEYAKILDSLAIFYLRINNHQIALKYLKDALKIKEEINNKRELAVTKLLIGRYLSSIENYEEAVIQLSDALAILEYFNDYSASSRIQNELAKIFFAQENSDLATEFCIKSINLAKKIQSPLIYAFSYCTLANIKIKKEEPEKALNLLQNEAQPIFINLASTRGYAFTKQTEAIAYYNLGQSNEAIKSIKEAIELFKEIGINAEIARCYYELSNIYRKTNDIPMAISSLLESLNIAKISNLSILIKKIEDFLFELDEEKWTSIVDSSAKKEVVSSYESKLIPNNSALDISGGNKDPLLALLRIGRSIAAETDVDKLLEIIAEETKKALDSDRCTVFLLDRENNELWSKVALGMGSQEIRFPAHMGLAGHVAMTGETINIKDTYKDSRFNREIDKKTGYRTKNLLCMPMRNLNHEIIGVFQVLNKMKKSSFTHEDEDLLIAIGSSAGIALENARLFKKQQLMYEEQKRSFNSFINTLAASIDARDKITAGHSKRVTSYAVAISEQMKMPKSDIEVLEYAAMLHDFGKIGIKDSVLCKEGKLTEEEYKHIQEHAFITNEILKTMFFEEKFKDVPEIASSHHEKYNGTGYFRKIKGEEIPLGGRILAVSDVFDAITSKRHYRDRMPFLQVLNILRKDSGSHFDGKIIDEFFKISIEKILHILSPINNETMPKNEKEYFKKHSTNDLHLMLLKDEKDRTDTENMILAIFKKYYDSAEES
ncbi:MAG: HD domain-containing phosphohydrolase [bacterium]